MANVNKVMLIGNLTRDPELKYTQKGLAVTNFTIAVNHIYTTQSGEKKEEADFIRIRVLGKQAENCAKYLNKGRSVYVEGRLQYRQWEAQDGQKRSSLDVLGYNIQFLGGGGSGGGGGQTAPQTQEQPAGDNSFPVEDDVPF